MKEARSTGVQIIKSERRFVCARKAMNEPCPLLQSLPPELMTEIFSHLPSLSDVFAFAAAHIQFRSIWHQNSNTIYATVAPKCIPCERYARSFVAQQTGREEASNEIQADDALKVVQNSSVVEKAIFQFEKQVVKRAKGSCLHVLIHASLTIR